jgi:hypothetical protein
VSDEVPFHQAMVHIYERAKKEAAYVATRFIQMVAEHGGLGAARQLLAASSVSEGFTTLWEKRRLDLSVEFHVLLPEYRQLFTEEERRVARNRLLSHGFDVHRIPG